MATVGLFYISSANFTPWNVNGESAIAGIGGGMAIALFSYLGVETIPYGFSALAQLKWRWVDHKAGQTSRFVRDMIVAVLSLVFSILFIWYSRNTGQSLWVYWAPFLLAGGALLLGIPVYASQRHHLTQPEPVPPYP
jgi:hypothetical protein